MSYDFFYIFYLGDNMLDLKKEIEIDFVCAVVKIILCEFLSKEQNPQETAEILVEKWVSEVKKHLEAKYVIPMGISSMEFNTILEEWKQKTKKILRENLKIDGEISQ
jgi:hypothetical protein